LEVYSCFITIRKTEAVIGPEHVVILSVLIHIVLLSARFIGGTAHSLWRPSHCPDTPTRSY